MLLHRLLEEAAARAAGDPALYFDGAAVSFGELAARSRRVAAATAELTGPGDRVALIGPNHPRWVECYYGVPRAGRILVFLNHRLAPVELASIVERSGARVVVGPGDQLERIRPRLAGGVRTVEVGEWEARLAGAGGAEAVAVSHDSPAWLIYTSGTTGLPKGAVLTHRSLAAALRAARVGRPVAPDDVQLLPFPLCHVAGYNVLHHHAAGRPVVLLERFDPELLLAAAERHGVTTSTLAATMLAAVLDHLDEHPERREALSKLRTISYGAAPMPPSLLRRAHDRLGTDFAQGYGMTELSGNAVFLDAAAHRRGLAGHDRVLASAGRPAPGVEVRVVDDRVRDAEVGEIVVRGELVMAGYWDDPEATRRAFAGGWFHTGDVGRWDAEGLLHVVDRKKDVIVTGGENVASRRVEEELLRCCPEVREAAVVGVADDRWGENVCAVVALRPGAALDVATAAGRLRDRLAGFELPRHLVVVDELPRNASGKILKGALRRWLAEHPEAAGERGAAGPGPPPPRRPFHV